MLAVDTPERVLAMTDLGVAYSHVPSNYAGPCRMTAEGRTKAVIVLPSVTDAENAARFAVGELGGYHASRVEPAPDAISTHASWDLWAFES